ARPRRLSPREARSRSHRRRRSRVLGVDGAGQPRPLRARAIFGAYGDDERDHRRGSVERCGAARRRLRHAAHAPSEGSSLKNAATLAAVVLAGCASIQPAVAPTSAVDPGSGYISGTFTRSSARGFAFAIRSQEGKEYFMSLGEDSKAPAEVNEQTVVIQVPPGTYAVWHWVAYAPSTKAVEMRRPVDNT